MPESSARPDWAESSGALGKKEATRRCPAWDPAVWVVVASLTGGDEPGVEDGLLASERELIFLPRPCRHLILECLCATVHWY